MPVTEGRKGLVEVYATSETAASVAEMGEWTVSGMTLPMIEYASFGDTVTRFKPGIMNPGEFSFSGYFDGSSHATTTNTVMLLTKCLNNGYAISNSTLATNVPLKKLRLWANTDSDLESYGFWSCTGSSGSVYITGMEIGTAKDGIGTVSLTGKVADGTIDWTTTT